MSHRIVIFENTATTLQTPDVSDELTSAQITKVDQIIAAGEPACSDEDFRYLQRRLARAFCQDD